jgi:uncharacterized protein (TIGR02117 family)
VKQRWHTGIVIETADADSSHFPEIKYFRSFRYIDIGWGDDEFYRHPDFDIGLALKALLYPTSSTIRVEGFNFEIGKYAGYSDIAYKIKFSRDSFNKLCEFISSTFSKNQESEIELIEERYSGNIRFYKAEGNYTMLNTCNTWVAEGFKSAGFNNDTKIVLAEELFDEIKKIKGSEQLK